MSFLEHLKEQRRSPVSVFHQYLLLAAHRESAIFLFFEGPDDQSFFLSAFRRIFDGAQEIVCLVCNGKRGVLETRAKIAERASTASRRLYFVDKDVDDFVGCPSPNSRDVYCTEFYSIENYLVSSEMFGIVWSDFFKLPAVDHRKEVALEKFESEYAKFVGSVKTIMGWIIERRRSGQKVRLRDFSLDTCFFLDEDLSFKRKTGGLGAMRRSCSDPVGVTEWRRVRRVCSELRRVEAKTYIRGKFDLWFFLKFVTRLDEALRETEDKRLRPKNRVTLSPSNAVDILAARCPVNHGLEEFLRSNLPGGA